MSRTQTSIESLPVEILSRIFYLVVEQFLPGSWGVAWHSLILASVCASWRALALDTPRLWRDICPHDQRLELVGLLLERSKNCPLYIFALTEEPIDDRILALLALHSERWKDVFFSMLTTSYRSLESIKGRLPLLTRLAFVGSGVEPDEIPTFDGFEVAPALEDVELGTLTAEVVEKIPIPYAQLTKLQGEFADAAALRSVLAQTPNLTELRLIRCDGGPEEVAPFVPIVLPHLRLLNLDMGYAGYSGDPGDILGSITAPVLSELIMSCEDGGVHGDERYYYVGSMVDFITRSGCDIKSFTLRVSNTCDPKLGALLRTMPHLDYLRIFSRKLEDPNFSLGQ